MPQDTPSRHLDQFLVRFPEGMRDRIASEAKKNNRSMNAEIIARIQASLDPEPAALTPELFDKLLRGIRSGVERIEKKLDKDEL